MLKKYPFLSGTLLLTLTGVISRIIGFFYRIYLSHHIGEEGMGIYQLLAPVMALSFSLTCAGIQTSISKYTASYIAQKQEKSALRILMTGFTLSLFLSIGTACFLYQNAIWVASALLTESRCAPLVRIYSLSLPFACIHSCINGYYYGMKKSMLPSMSQLVEQLARVGSVFAIYSYGNYMGTPPSIAVTMLGILIGEICATTLSLGALYFHLSRRNTSPARRTSTSYLQHLSELLHMAVPLAANRLTLNFLQSVEAVQIPNRLVLSGMSKSSALANYGVLTGMTYPLILFPSAVTSSVSVLLLPYISEAGANGDTAKIKSAIRKSVLACLLLGSFFCILFLFFGPFLGEFLFGSQLAGTYIQILSIACPLLYLGGILTSILHGLGKALQAFFLNASCLLVRLGFVFFLIPKVGMTGYLLGIFVSELCLIVLMSAELTRHLRDVSCKLRSRKI
ncbi:MAG: polysaccharide biosynthesis protein [Lachnospiraceae bacterium]|nr:polysaccharide biosynthesis protein [Lachnospiraceae bacterium]